TLINSFLSFVKLFPTKKLDKESIDDKIIKSSERIYPVKQCETRLDPEVSKELKELSEKKICGTSNKVMQIQEKTNKVMQIQEKHPFGLALKLLEELIDNLRLTRLKKISPNKTEMEIISRLLSGLSTGIIKKSITAEYDEEKIIDSKKD
ncbi:18888_t:CDS:2, partial [Racocetra fulgida]